MSEIGSENIRKLFGSKNVKKSVQKHQKIDPNPKCHTIRPSPKMSEKFGNIKK